MVATIEVIVILSAEKDIIRKMYTFFIFVNKNVQKLKIFGTNLIPLQLFF